MTMTTVQIGPADTIEHDVFGCAFVTSRLPVELEREAYARFEELWTLRPERFHEITQPFTGKSIPLPRWQQAYGRDYCYSGTSIATLACQDDVHRWSRGRRGKSCWRELRKNAKNSGTFTNSTETIYSTRTAIPTFDLRGSWPRKYFPDYPDTSAIPPRNACISCFRA